MVNTCPRCGDYILCAVCDGGELNALLKAGISHEDARSCLNCETDPRKKSAWKKYYRIVNKADDKFQVEAEPIRKRMVDEMKPARDRKSRTVASALKALSKELRVDS